MAIENITKIVQYRDTKASVEALAGTLEEAAISFATDTGQLGVYTNGAWVWINATGTSSGGGYTQGARVYNSGNVALGNGTDDAIIFNAERYDTDNMHSGTSTQLYCNTSGKYLMVANIEVSANSVLHNLFFKLNGTTDIGRIVTPGNGASPLRMNLSTIYNLNAGDYIETYINVATSGQTLNSTANRSPEVSIQRIG